MQVGYDAREDMAVSVVVLQTFAQQSGPAGGSADQEALSARIGEGPDRSPTRWKPNIE